MFFKYRDEILECINDLKSRETIYKQIPNMITLLRIIGIIPINILYFLGNKIAALITCAVVLLTDMVDGKIARKYNITSRVGAKLDAVCDKLMVLGLSIPLIVIKPLLLLNLGMELGISITNILNEKKGYNPKSVMVGKIKTCLLSITLGVGYLSTYISISKIIFPLLVVITSVMQGMALREYITLYRECSKNKDIDIDIEKEATLLDLSEDKELVKEKNEVREKIEYLKREKELILDSKKEMIPLAKTYMRRMGNNNFKVKNK